MFRTVTRRRGVAPASKSARPEWERRFLLSAVPAEASVDEEAGRRGFVPPSWCGDEVTAGDRCSGGSLARFGSPTSSVPSVELVVVTQKDRSVLRRLLQLYLHDFSEFLDTDVDPQ